MKEFWLIGGMAVVTFGIRYTLFAAAEQIRLPESLAQSLKYVPPAVLTAIIVPSVLMPAGTIDVSPQNAYLIAALVAFIVGWFRENLLLTIVSGMTAFFLWQIALSLL